MWKQLLVCQFVLINFCLSVDVTHQNLNPAHQSPQQNSNNDLIAKRNFLRFGKRSMEEMVEPSVPSSVAKGSGLHRRDYREFVRFGKRSFAPSNANARWCKCNNNNNDNAAPQEDTEDLLERIFNQNLKEVKRHDDFLRFGKSVQLVPDHWNFDDESKESKRSNDFLRFG